MREALIVWGGWPGHEPERCAAIEDSENGMRSAASAGMRVVAIPNRVFPPGTEALSLAGVVLGSLDELTPEAIERLSPEQPAVVALQQPP